jgi:hypothetical protein
MYEEAANALKPTSRTQLAKHLAAKTSIPFKTALQVVDVYCEKNSVPVPDYLGRDFNIGWLKVVSVVTASISIAACWYGRNLHIEQRNSTGAWVVALLFGGLAVFMWLRSIEEEVSSPKN